MSLKMKLTSAIIMFMLAIATLVIGVLAAQTQSINMEGTINFEISDRSLYVKNVHLEDSDGSEIEITSFMPGYINDGITLSLGTHTVSNTSFKIHFDLINTTSNTYEAGDVTLSSELQSANVIASASGTISPTSETIPEGENYAPITSTTPISGTITLSINSPNTTSIDLSGITVAINQLLRNYSQEGFVFDNGTLTRYNGTAHSLVIPSSYSINEDGEFIEGNEYVVTAIEGHGGASAYVLSGENLTNITIPSTIERIYGDVVAERRSYAPITIIYNNSSINLTPGSSDFGSIAYWAKEVITPSTPANERGKIVIENEVQYYIDADNTCKIALAPTIDRGSVTTMILADDITDMDDCFLNECSNILPNLNENDGLLYLGSLNHPYLVLVAASDTSKTQYTIGDNCKIICGYALYGCSSMTNVVIPSTVIIIKDTAFLGCSSLQSINFSSDNQLQSIGSSAFSGCSSLENIDFINNGKITEIASGVFQDCTSLTTVTIPDMVTSIGANAFSGCTSLATVNIDLNNSQLSEIGDSAFYNCSALTTISVPASVTELSRTFIGCTSLESVIFGENSQLTRLDNMAFWNCSSLTSITIPEKVTYIQYSSTGVFSGCSSLITVTIESESIYQTVDGTNNGYLLQHATTVKVPTIIVNSYDNSYLESSNFTTGTEMIGGVKYTVFTKNNA